MILIKDYIKDKIVANIKKNFINNCTLEVRKCINTKLTIQIRLGLCIKTGICGHVIFIMGITSLAHQYNVQVGAYHLDVYNQATQAVERAYMLLQYCKYT